MTDTNAQPTDGLEFVHSGIIRFHFGPDSVVRVRRPFLGELKTLRLALADVQEDLAPAITRAVAEGQNLAAQNREAEADLEAGATDPEGFASRLAAIRALDRKAGAEIEEERERLMLAWWGDVFDLLAMDKVPDDYPAWILDAQLPGRVLTHWRTVPAGPG